jgi:hypothetical protein
MCSGFRESAANDAMSRIFAMDSNDTGAFRGAWQVDGRTPL